MAEAFLKSFDSTLEVYSAGTNPEKKIHPLAVKVLHEKGLDISGKSPAHVNRFTRESFDYVITVCDEAQEKCPVFTGKVKNRIHFGFEDPAAFEGMEEEKLRKFRKIRDQIEKTFKNFYDKEIKS